MTLATASFYVLGLESMSVSRNFLGRSLRLGRRLTTAAKAAQTEPVGAVSNLEGGGDAGKIWDAANKTIKENLAFKYIWKVSAGVGLASLGLGLQIYKMDSEINKMGGEIQKVEVHVGAVEKALNENTKQLTTIQAENSKRFDKLDLVLSSLAPKIAVMENNIAWMRGDYRVVNREHGPSNQETKPPTDEPSEDEDSSDH
ncbi:hypothetical protein Ndes2526B_g00941 [Nannochloris sp. 'desiccata']